ncbi:MAG: iron-containing alcohol dehydrogenase [Lachnospiraceae bacterium]|nr:iron-containing alcohol dehydrogenase [Lachnospiraceae bacterium]
MKYYMPVRLYDEKDCVVRHADDIANVGRKALIVTGRRSAFLNGAFDDLISALSSGGVSYLVFSEVEENPSTDTVLSAAARFAGEGVDMVIGIGGGSAMDAAKAIALLLRHPGAGLDYLYDPDKSPEALPVICVPTTCGTGSEVTGVSVLTRHDKKTKISMVHKVFPVLSLIDGKYLKNAPHSLIVNSSVDALAHLYESLLNQKADDYVKMTAFAGLGMWSLTRDVLTGKRECTDEDRSYLMRSSAIAGMSIAQSGTSIPHALSYTITYDLGIAHGMAAGFFLPGFIALAPGKERKEILNLSGFADTDELTSFIANASGGINIPDDELEKAYEKVRNNEAKMKSASFDIDEKTLRDIVWYMI